MKKYFKLLAYFLITGSIFIAVSCQDEPLDVPPVVVPRVDFKANTNLMQLKRKFALTNIQKITDDIIIKGIVVSNDESGNIYKAIYIQDDSSGLEIDIDSKELYRSYKPGQILYIKCKGLYIGKYGEVLKLGYIYNNGIGRIPNVTDTLNKYIYKDSLPGAVPEPKLLKLDEITDQYIGMLVRLDSICFPDSGQVYATNTATTNRNMFDTQGHKIILRTSNYATFKDHKLPAGRGTIVGILSRFVNDYQIYIRDLNDVKF